MDDIKIYKGIFYILIFAKIHEYTHGSNTQTHIHTHTHNAMDKHLAIGEILQICLIKPYKTILSYTEV